jgi:hypothetical protein
MVPVGAELPALELAGCWSPHAAAMHAPMSVTSPTGRRTSASFVAFRRFIRTSFVSDCTSQGSWLCPARRFFLNRFIELVAFSHRVCALGAGVLEEARVASTRGVELSWPLHLAHIDECLGKSCVLIEQDLPDDASPSAIQSGALLDPRAATQCTRHAALARALLFETSMHPSVNLNE